ncbi:hypothetical protein AB4Z22_27730 [Paenibacillus sp. TAF58]
MTKMSEITRMYEKGNYANTYKEVAATNPGLAWREGMISGNGENGYITSSEPRLHPEKTMFRLRRSHNPLKALRSI